MSLPLNHPDMDDESLVIAGRRRRWHPRPRPHRVSFGFLADSERIVIVKQRFPSVLVPATLRTLIGILLVGGQRPWAAVLLVGAVSVLLRLGMPRDPVRWVLKLGVYLCPLVLLCLGLATLPAPVQRVLVLGYFLIWFTDQLAEWQKELLILTTERLWHVSGVWTTKHPSISIRGATFTDAVLPWYFKFPPTLRRRDVGYMNLDTNVQADVPLQQFGPVSGVTTLNRLIQQTRAASYRRGPAAETMQY